MQEDKIDRRIQRTEQAFREALISLLIKKGYAEISVQDILDQANMGRSTFYAHYRDKKDLLISGFKSILDDFVKEYTLFAGQHADPENHERELTLFLFQHANEHRLLFKSMAGKKGGEEIHLVAQEYLTQVIKTYFTQHYHNKSSRYPMNLLANYTINSFLVVLGWWLEQSATITPQEINTIFWDIAGPGIQTALKPQN